MANQLLAVMTLSNLHGLGTRATRSRAADHRATSSERSDPSGKVQGRDPPSVTTADPVPATMAGRLVPSRRRHPASVLRAT
jgi:hypothetical protein